MNILIVLIPVSVFLGALGLGACIWTLRHGQYEDLEGDAARLLLDDDDAPRPQPGAPSGKTKPKE